LYICFKLNSLIDIFISFITVLLRIWWTRTTQRKEYLYRQ